MSYIETSTGFALIGFGDFFFPLANVRVVGVKEGSEAMEIGEEARGAGGRGGRGASRSGGREGR